jgi:hypothetical protein
LLVILVVAVTSLVNLGFFWLLNYPSLRIQYSSHGNVYVTGIQAQGGDLQNNSIDWGTIYAASSSSASFYVQSTSNLPIKLDYNTTDWAPQEIGLYLNLTWNYNQTQLEPNQETLLTFTLTAPRSEEFENYLLTNNVTAFSFNLNLYAVKPQAPIEIGEG